MSDLRLQSADAPDTNVGDMISRKQAIEAMGEKPYVWSDDDEYLMGQRGMWVTTVTILRSLPPVEPEIIRCKDCKHRGEEPIADGRYWCDIHDTFMYYCSDAERKEDE